MDDHRQTAPDLTSVLEELKVREPIFHRLELWSTSEDFDHLMAEDYWEIGASGRIYDRVFILNELEKRSNHEMPPDWKTSSFHLRQISADTYLLTYSLQQKERLTRRSTLWKKTGQSWQILFHQGTVVQD